MGKWEGGGGGVGNVGIFHLSECLFPLLPHYVNGFVAYADIHLLFIFIGQRRGIEGEMVS